MPYSGTTYSLPRNMSADDAAGIKILAANLDENYEDIEAALNQVMLRDGSTPLSGDQDLNGNRFTGVGAAQSADNYVTLQQATEQVGIFLAGNIANGHIELSSGFNVNVSEGTLIRCNITSANASTPTLGVDGQNTTSVLGDVAAGATFNGSKLMPGAMYGVHQLVFRQNTWVLQDPSEVYPQAKLIQQLVGTSISISATTVNVPFDGNVESSIGSSLFFVTNSAGGDGIKVPDNVRRVEVMGQVAIQTSVDDHVIMQVRVSTGGDGPANPQVAAAHYVTSAALAGFVGNAYQIHAVVSCDPGDKITIGLATRSGAAAMLVPDSDRNWLFVRALPVR